MVTCIWTMSHNDLQKGFNKFLQTKEMLMHYNITEQSFLTTKVYQFWTLLNDEI